MHECVVLRVASGVGVGGVCVGLLTIQPLPQSLCKTGTRCLCRKLRKVCMPRFGHSSVVGCFVICWVGSVGSGDALVPFSVLCVYLWCILICGCTLFTVYFLSLYWWGSC